MVCQQRSVLIVNDEQVVSDLLYGELSERGFLCTAACDGRAAFSKLMTQCFDVVLLDIRLPGMSGMDLLRQLRLNCPKTVAIMVTAVEDVDTVVQSIKLGASDYVLKPFDLDRVEASINTALQVRKSTASRGTVRLTTECRQCNYTRKEFPEMNAIALGVQARYDNIIGLSRIVTEEASAIALRLGIPEQHVQHWVEMRTRLDFEKRRVIELSLAKLERNPLAQVILGMTELLDKKMPDYSSN